MNNTSMRITVVLTEQCNLKCTYCYVAKHDHSSVMSDERIIDMMQYIETLTTKFSTIQLEIFGGEPMLFPTKIQRILTMTDCIRKRTNCNILVTIFTNAILLTNEVLMNLNIGDWVQYHVSRDGCEECHNRTRTYKDGSGSFNETIKGIELLNSFYRRHHTPKFMLSPDNMEYLLQSIKYSMQQNETYISIGIVRDDIWSDTSIDRCIDILNEAADFYIANIDHPLMMDLFIYPLIDYTYASNTYCSVGRGHLAIAPNGNIYPCQRFYNYDPSNFILGTIYTGINHQSEAYKQFQTYSIKTHLTECKSCKTFKNYNCLGMCLASVYESTGTPFATIPSVCRLLQANYHIARRIQTALRFHPIYINSFAIIPKGG